MADLNIQLILRLVDKATAPAREAMTRLDSLSGRAIAAGREQIAISREQIGLAQERQSRLLGEAGALAAQGYAMVQSLRPAIAFEEKMAEVGKVVDFTAPDGIAKLGRDIQALTTSGGLPMAADGIAEIVAAAAQANLVDAGLPDAQKRAELVAFADAAAKMGVAFDISAGEAGSAMAVWRSSLGLTQDQALSLGDAVNHLSNNMNASAADLTTVIQRQGAVAAASGLATQEVAALSAALLSGGAPAEIAATALKNFTGALSSGEAMTDRQSAVMKKLGLDTVEMSKRMQVDAKGAIIDVMEALAELPAYEQGASLKQLFGEESIGAIQPLLSNLGNLRRAFGLVADEQSYAGAMTEEYQKVAATSAARLRVLGNYTVALAVTVGTVLLPMLLAAANVVMPVVQAMSDWAAAHPGLVKGIAMVVAGLWGFRTVIVIARSVMLQLQIVFWLFNGVLGGVSVAFGLVTKAALFLGSGLGMLGRVVLPLVWTALRVTASAVLMLGRAMLTTATVALRYLLVGLHGVLRAAGSMAVVVFRTLALAIRGVGLALTMVGRAMLANPILLVIAAIAAGAYVIYRNWDGIVSYFRDKIEAVRAAFDQGLLNGVLKALAEFNPFLLMYDAAEGLFRYLTGWDFADVTRALREAFTSIDFVEIGVSMMRALWEGLRSVMGQIGAWFREQAMSWEPGWLRSARNFVSGSGAESGPAAPAIAGGRALGGPVRAGQIYRWQEEGQELFVPRVDGSVISNRALQALEAPARIRVVQGRSGQGLGDGAARGGYMPSASAARPAPRIDLGGITINAAPGMSPADVARAVRAEIARMARERGFALHDGGDFA